MANIQSSKKDIRRIKSRTERNRVVISRIRTLRKKVVSTVSANDTEALPAAASAFASALDKAAKRSIIHPNKANRIKSRLAKLAKSVATPSAE